MSGLTVRERVLATAGDGGPLYSLIAESARRARLAHEEDMDAGIVTAASSTVGPLLSAYVLWVLLDTVKRGGRAIHFLARDGQIMVALCRWLVDWLQLDIDVRYTYASRQAFLLSSLAGDQDNIIERALEMARSHATRVTLAEAVVGFLKFSAADLDRISRMSAVPVQADINTLDEQARARLHGVLGGGAFPGQLRERAAEEHRAAIAYLESQGFFDAADVTIVDVGWRGNIQLRLRNTVGGRVNIVGYYLALQNSVLGPGDQVRTWMDASWKAALIETMTSADHTSIAGFALSPSGAPQVLPPLAEDAALVAWGVRDQQAVAVDFLRHLSHAIDPGVFGAECLYQALKTAGYAAYRHFGTFPTAAEAEAYGGAKGQANPARAARIEIATKVTSLEMMRFTFDKKARGAVSDWYMGSVMRSKDRWAPALLAGTLAIGMELLLRIKTWRARRATFKPV